VPIIELMRNAPLACADFDETTGKVPTTPACVSRLQTRFMLGLSAQRVATFDTDYIDTVPNGQLRNMLKNTCADARRPESTSRLVLSTLPTSTASSLNNIQFRSHLSRLLCTIQPTMQGVKLGETCLAVGKESGKTCGAPAGITGLHPSQCHCGAGFNVRHDEFSCNIAKMWASAGVHATRESTNVGNGKKPLAAPRAGRDQPKRSRSGESDCITPDITLFGSSGIGRYIDVTTLDRQNATSCKSTSFSFTDAIRRKVDAKMQLTYRAEWLSVPVKTIRVQVISATGDLCKSSLDGILEASKLAQRACLCDATEFATFWRRKIVFAHIRKMGDTAVAAGGAFYGNKRRRGGRVSAAEAAIELEQAREDECAHHGNSISLSGRRHAL
jgi:hypothetical protein